MLNSLMGLPPRRRQWQTICLLVAARRQLLPMTLLRLKSLKASQWQAQAPSLSRALGSQEIVCKMACPNARSARLATSRAAMRVVIMMQAPDARQQAKSDTPL